MSKIRSLKIREGVAVRATILDAIANDHCGRAARVILGLEIEDTNQCCNIYLSPAKVGRLIDWLQRWWDETQGEEKP